MGKKRRMIAHPKKFGAKYANHPATTTTPVVEEPVVETPVAKEAVETPTTTTDKATTEKDKSFWSRKKTDQSTI